MSETRSTDMGDYVLVETGDPTLANPSVSYSRDMQWKAGTPAANQASIQTALQNAVTYFGGNYTNWSTLSNAQKDTAAKNAQRALAQIARWLLGQFDSAG